MQCTKCRHASTKVIETRRLPDSQVVRRSRLCKCGNKFATYEVDEGIWPTVRKWALASHDKALQKATELRKRNEEIVKRVRAGEKRWLLAEEYGLSGNMVTHITRKAGLPAYSRFNQGEMK